MRDAYNEQMNELANLLGEMAALAGSAMDTATQSLLQADLVLAEQVISDHDKITDLSAVCEEKAFTLLALQAPVAGDLRSVVSGIQIVADIDPLLADTHAFEELRLLSQLRSRATTLTDDEMVSLRRIIGGAGTDAASRLGLGPDSADDGPRAAFAATQRWRRRADHPLNDPFTTRACRAAVRSAEALVALYSSRR